MRHWGERFFDLIPQGEVCLRQAFIKVIPAKKTPAQ